VLRWNVFEERRRSGWCGPDVAATPHCENSVNDVLLDVARPARVNWADVQERFARAAGTATGLVF